MDDESGEFMEEAELVSVGRTLLLHERSTRDHIVQHTWCLVTVPLMIGTVSVNCRFGRRLLCCTLKQAV